MGFFSDMGFFEKVAFVVCAPIIAPFAVASVAYDAVTSDDGSSTTQSEAEEQARRQAKEQAATKEREDIVAFAKERLLELQGVYRPSLDVERTSESTDGSIGGSTARSLWSPHAAVAISALAAVALTAVTLQGFFSQLSFPKLRNAVNSALSDAEILDGLLPPLAENEEIKSLNKEMIEMKEFCVIFQNLEKMV